MPVQLFKYAKRGEDKLIGGLATTSSGRGSAYGDNGTITWVHLDFGNSYEKEGKFIVRGTADDMKALVSTISQSAVSFDGTVKERYHPKLMVPYAVAWLRSIADELERIG